jgi:hypothetical protein
MTYGRSDIKSPFIFATTLRISDKLSLHKKIKCLLTLKQKF